MAALLVGLSIMGVLMSMALPVWSHFTKREREAELIWRGQQYARAIMLFQRQYANTFPPNIDVLVERKFLRKKYKDPITNEDFQPIPVTGSSLQGGLQRPGQGGIPQTSPQRSPAQQGSPAQEGSQPQQGSFSPQQRGGPGGTVATVTMAPAVGIQGVVSKSNATSIKTYNGRTKYNEWAFVYVATAQRIGPGGVQQPGVPPGSQQAPGAFQRGGATFSPMGGVDRRPGVNPTGPFPPGTGPSGFPPGGGQFPQQPSPFRPPPPFGPSAQPPPSPPRPPGS